MSLFDKVVYRHRRLSDDSVFYIGIGNKQRPFVKTKRNSYWQNIVKKDGYYVEVIQENLSFEDAKELEVFLISLYGRKDIKTGILCNMSDGGDGSNLSPEVRKKISERRKGIRNVPLDYVITKEHREKISLAKKGKQSTFKGKKHTDKAKEIIKQKRALQVFSKETLIKKSESVKGGKNPAAVKVINIETKQIFDTMKEAADSANISLYHLRMYFSGKYKNNTNLIKLKDYEFI
jgi:hypothetical protein